MSEKPKPPIEKIIFESKFIKIEITDPNILDELNTVNKYASNLIFKALQININRKGGRYFLKTEDRKEVTREIYSGISRKETEPMEYFQVVRKS